MAAKRRFSFKWFMLGFLVALFLFLMGVPLCSSNYRDGRKAEGEQMLGSAKGMVRVAIAKTERTPSRLTGALETGGARAEPGELQGKYYRVLDHVSPRGSKGAALFAVPTRRNGSVATLEFELHGGDGKFTHQYGGGQ